MATAIAFAGRGQAEGSGMKIAFRSLPRSAQPLLTPPCWLQLLLPPHGCPRAELSAPELLGELGEVSKGGWVRQGEQWAHDSMSASLHSSKITKNMILQYVIDSCEEAVKGFVLS